MAEVTNEKSQTPVNTAYNQQWLVDKTLDKQEKLTSEDINQKYHNYLSQLSIEEGRGSTKDRQARMAEIVASKNLII